MKKVVIYSRVSTDIQNNQRQIKDLTEYSNTMGYDLIKVFEETISGAKKNEERKELISMIDFVVANKIDKVLVWELSRLGRNVVEVLKTIELFNDKGISLYIKNHHLETLKDDKTINPMTMFMVQILSSVSQMERTQIRERIKSGYENYRKSGGVVGRKKGFKVSNEDLLEKHNDVVKYLKKGFSIRETMKLTDKSDTTVKKIRKLIIV